MSKENEFGLGIRNARIAVSPRCNFNCIYCDSNEIRTSERPGAMEDFRRGTIKETGLIETQTYIEIIHALHSAGFNGITLTGGEPLLNKDWDIIVNKAKEKGMERVAVTTNGALLLPYLENKKHMPEGITTLTISLDTTDPTRFRDITKHNAFEQIMNGLKAVKKDKPDLPIRANKVVMRSDMASLPEYISFCENSGVIDEINLLNLILKEPKHKDFFEKEFINAQEITHFLTKYISNNFILNKKYEYEAKTEKGTLIIVKDTNLTMRSNLCNDCPIYCQEGFYTVRVATDGNINTCIDYEKKLSSINGQLELKNNTLPQTLSELTQSLCSLKLKETLESFFIKNSLQIRTKV